MSAKHITSGQYRQIKRLLQSAQSDARSLSRTKRLLTDLVETAVPAHRPTTWAITDLAVLSGESARAFISRFKLRVKSK